MNTVSVSITRESGCEDILLPAYETAHASGMDVRAAVTAPITVAPGERVLVPTGLRIALPPGVEAQIRPRSGLAIRNGISMVNSPGTIDADYRGEIHIILINHGGEPFQIQRGDRIAQMVITPVLQASWNHVEALDTTSRGEGGLGHTGT